MDTVEQATPARVAYEATAPFYDRLTAHHDYDLWLGNLIPALEREGLSGRRLLDVACGTGKSFIPLLADGWEVVGVDCSPGMLEIARDKVGDRAKLLSADMRELPRLGTFDLVWCLDDAINYLEDVDELACVFRAMAGNLSDNGLCLFDVNELAMYRGFYTETQVIGDDLGSVVVRGQESAAFESGHKATAVLEMLDEGGRVVISATHCQRHFPRPVVEQALALAGLSCVQIYGHGYDAVLTQPLDPLIHTKAVYIARKHGR